MVGSCRFGASDDGSMGKRGRPANADRKMALIMLINSKRVDRRRIAAPMIRAACALLLAVTGCGSTNASLAIPAQPPTGMTELRKVVLGTPLRGYGSLGGEYVEYGSTPADPAVSILLVRCRDAKKARIALAKYRSDLRCLKGVTEASVTLRDRQVPPGGHRGQGEIAAARSGSKLVHRCGKTTRWRCSRHLAALNLETTVDLDVGRRARRLPPTWTSSIAGGSASGSLSRSATPEKQEQTYDVRENSNGPIRWASACNSIFSSIKPAVPRAFSMIPASAGALSWPAAWAFPSSCRCRAPAPGWIANRYADEMQQKVPQYAGGWYGINGRNGFAGSPLNTLSWASVAGKNRLFADQYQAVRKYKSMPNVTGYGEWHGEVGEDVVAMLMDHGPVADARYRDYLRQKYRRPQTVDQRWSGGQGMIKTWDDVRMPEPANFLGWSERAVDLQGEWRLCEIAKLPVETKDRWGATDLQDGAWRKLTVPGDDHQLFRENWRVPTIFRRVFHLGDEQLARLKAAGKAWLYVLTLQQGGTAPLRAVLNGKSLADQPLDRWASWVVVDVTERLRKGDNLLALSLPWGELSYRVYLSPDAPRYYPDLGKEKNAQWVDYRDFISWMREDCLRRSIEAIRHEDPDKFIKIYAPGAITDVMKGLAEDYGCYFHDTGGMSGCWNDCAARPNAQFRIADESRTGRPRPNAARAETDVWLLDDRGTEHGGLFHGHRRHPLASGPESLVRGPPAAGASAGKVPLSRGGGGRHGRRARPSAQRLPLGSFRHAAALEHAEERRRRPRASARPAHLIGESDFLRGNVNKYKVIVDDATLIMDEALVAKIEQWVRGGGIFITQGQTGRHRPETPDAWPINRLTGYRAGGNNDNWRVSAIAGQPIFTDPAWTQLDKNGSPVLGGAGLYLEKVAPECQDILTWPNKAGIAMGVRPLGKGKVITMGTPMPNAPNGWVELLGWCGVTMPAAPTAPGCRVAHFVSNNGLYDVYVVAADQINEPAAVTLAIPGKQATMLSVLTGARRSWAPSSATRWSLPDCAWNLWRLTRFSRRAGPSSAHRSPGLRCSDSGGRGPGSPPLPRRSSRTATRSCWTRTGPLHPFPLT